MANYLTEAVVLKRSDFGEADRIITFLTKNRGKITAIAKGVKRLESRKRGHVELLNQVKLGVAEGKNLDVLTEAEVIDSFPHIREDLTRVAWSYQVVELIDHLTQPHQENHLIYNLLVKTLQHLNFTEDDFQVPVYLRAFETKLLDLSGFRPNLSTCANCHKILLPEQNFLSPDQGGILDSGCVRSSSVLRPITPEAIKILRFLQDETWEQIEKIKIPLSLGKEIEQHLRFYWEYILERSLKSNHFIQKVTS